MQFLHIRCLACQNIDEHPPLNYDEIPYCSQCASTTSLVPELATPSKQLEMDMELAALFSRNLTLTPPTSPPATAANFSISQHYNHSQHYHDASAQQQLLAEQQQEAENQYAAYVQQESERADRQVAEAYGVRGLKEDCGAMEMLQAAERERNGQDPVFRSSEWFNDYYGGLDREVAMGMEDEESPCCVGIRGEGLRRFDY